MKSKLIKYSLILLIGFYLGNITAIELPKPREVKLYLEELARKIEKLRKEKETKKVARVIEFQINHFEKYMIELVNQQRELHKLKKLKFDNSNLFKVARQHSKEMMNLNYFSHTSPVKKHETLKERLELVNEDITRAGENISFTGCCNNCNSNNVELSMFGGKLKGIEIANGKVEILTSSIMQEHCFIKGGKGLMNSEGHRANILNPEFEYIGIGIVTGKGKFKDYEGQGMWITQVFTSY